MCDFKGCSAEKEVKGAQSNVGGWGAQNKYEVVITD